jgi:predicted RNase H-like nuclease (RuvC/YqgF family)
MNLFSFAAGELANRPILLDGATYTKTEKLVSTIEDIKETTLRHHEQKEKQIKKQKVDIACLEKGIESLHNDIDGLMVNIAEKDKEIESLKRKVEILLDSFNLAEEENRNLERKNKRIKLALESLVENEFD